MKKRGTRPLHRPYGVTSREDCNNRDRRARRMRRPIKAGREETLRLISRQRITFPPPSSPSLCICPASGSRRAPSRSRWPGPDKILLGHPSTRLFLLLSDRYLHWQEQRQEGGGGGGGRGEGVGGSHPPVAFPCFSR